MMIVITHRGTHHHPVSSLIFSFHISGNEIFHAPNKLTRLGSSRSTAEQRCQQTLLDDPFSIPTPASRIIRCMLLGGAGGGGRKQMRSLRL
jgi:hypothetical protein